MHPLYGMGHIGGQMYKHKPDSCKWELEKGTLTLMWMNDSILLILTPLLSIYQENVKRISIWKNEINM